MTQKTTLKPGNGLAGVGGTWQVFGDWRDLRGAIERVIPEWSDMPDEDRERLWNFAQSVIAEYTPMKAKCLECGELVHARSAYRCTECKAHLCERCIYPHFGQSMWRHK